MCIVIYEKFAYVYKCMYVYAHVLEVGISVCLMVGCRFQFCKLHMLQFAIVHASLYVCSKFSLTYIANPFRLCVASLSLTISGILLNMSGRLDPYV